MQKNVVLFDLDNTLYEYDIPHEKALKKAYKILRQHIKITYPKFLRLYKSSTSEIKKELSGTASAHNRILYFQRLVEKTYMTIEPKVILQLYNAYWNTFLKKMKLKRGTKKLLKDLKIKGIRTAIVSDLTTQIQLRKIKKLGITKQIDVLVTSEEAGSEKPHAIMFLLALHKLDSKPQNAIMVGDNSNTDILGANAVGIETVLLTDKKIKNKLHSDYKKPNYKIKNITEILNVLEKIESKARANS